MNEAQRTRFEQADRIAVDLAHYIENEEGALSAYVLLKIRDAVTDAWAAATAEEREACLNIAKSMVSPVDITAAIRARQEKGR